MTFRIAALAGFAAICAVSAQAASGVPEHAHEHDGGAAHGATGTAGGPGKATDVTRTVRIDAGDTTFNVKQIQVKAGETIKFVIASHDEHLQHRKLIQEMAGMEMDDEPNAVTVDPGQTKELIWKFGKDKDVEFACDIPGHAEQGMAGKFRVLK